MKNTFLFKLSAAFAGLTFSLAASFSSAAAVPAGTLEGADSSSIYGWAWDSDNYNHVIPIELSVYSEGTSDALKTVTIKADHYQDKLQEDIGDGYHGFLYSMDWGLFDETQLRVTAYAVTETERVFLGELTYNKETDSHTPVNSTLDTPLQSDGPVWTSDSSDVQTVGPSSDEPDSDTADRQALAPVDKQVSTPAPAGGQTSTPAPADGQSPESSSSVKTVSAPNGGDQSDHSSKYWEFGPGVTPKEKPLPEGTSLGMFSVTGYCNCDLCSSGSQLTYSGTMPQAGHTISADISLYPIGTKLRIKDIIYTVEDIGSNVVQNKVDIYYDTHEEALAHGTQQMEVFLIPEA